MLAKFSEQKKTKQKRLIKIWKNNTTKKTRKKVQNIGNTKLLRIKK